MDKRNCESYGNLLISCSLLGIFTQFIINNARKRYISDLVSHALINPSKHEIEKLGGLDDALNLFGDGKPVNELPENTEKPRTINGRMIYLSGMISGSEQIHEDYLFGYKIKGLVLKREVEMYQWTEASPGVYIKQWAKEPISSKMFPHNKRNPPWMFFSEEFKVKGLTKFMNFWIKTSEVLKVLEFKRCSFKKEEENKYSVIQARKNEIKENFKTNCQRLIMNKTKIQSRLTEMFFKNLKLSKVTRDYLFLETKQNGYYRVSYKVCLSDDVITVLGINYNGKLEPIGNQLVVKGHKNFDEMVRMIDTAPNKTITYTLTSTLILGMILRFSV